MCLPDTMRAAQFDRYGSPEDIVVRTVPLPRIRSDQVLVRVHASSVNKGELFLIKGKARLLSGSMFPKGVGSDFAGIVVALGTDVTLFSMGDPVWGIIPGLKMLRSSPPTATAADYVAIDQQDAHPLPKGIAFASAASLALIGPTALKAVAAAKPMPGERVLVRGAAGGVGSVMVQLAQSRGAHVTALAREDNRSFLENLGAAHVVDYKTSKPSDLPRYDVILDAVGSNMLAYRGHLKKGGRMVTVAAEPLVGGLLEMAISYIYGRHRIRFSQGDPTTSDFDILATEMMAGRIKPAIGRRLSLEEVASAYQRVDSRGTEGKTVIDVVPNRA